MAGRKQLFLGIYQTVQSPQSTWQHLIMYLVTSKCLQAKQVISNNWKVYEQQYNANSKPFSSNKLVSVQQNCDITGSGFVTQGVILTGESSVSAIHFCSLC